MARNMIAVIDVGISVAIIEARDDEPESFASYGICQQHFNSKLTTREESGSTEIQPWPIAGHMLDVRKKENAGFPSQSNSAVE